MSGESSAFKRLQLIFSDPYLKVTYDELLKDIYEAILELRRNYETHEHNLPDGRLYTTGPRNVLRTENGERCEKPSGEGKPIC
jgi:hypothetical protein